MWNAALIAYPILFMQLSGAAPKIDCGDPKGGYEESHCADQKFKAADKKLNETYRDIKGKISKEQTKLLFAAQKGWIQLRDNHCSLEVFATRGTTGNNGQYLDCLSELTELRTKQLESTPTDSTLE